MQLHPEAKSETAAALQRQVGAEAKRATHNFQQITTRCPEENPPVSLNLVRHTSSPFRVPAVRSRNSEDIMTANYSEEGADRVPCDISATGHQFKGSLATAGLFDWAEIDDDLRGDQRVEFADPREAEFARALDAHHISWRYKSRTFAVDWDDEGNFVDSFTPDFYLPDYGQYVELDTADQSLTEKNRGLRLLRRHQPWIKIELVRRSEYDESIEQFASIGKWRYSTR